MAVEGNTSRRRVFVIGPIGPEGSATRKRADDILKHLIKPAALECGLDEPVRADELAEPGEITEQVIERLLEDELVIADLHGHNPNVYYELAIRHTTGRAFIHLAQTQEELPFDTRTMRTIFIDERDRRSWDAALGELKRHILAVQARPPRDSPITKAYQILQARRHQGLLDAFALMEPSRPARQIVRDAAKENKTWKDLSKEQRTAVDSLCRAFDILGMYDRIGLVNRLHVDCMYSVPFVELYESFLCEYVAHLRQDGERGPLHFWELVVFYERVRHVPSNHPARTGQLDWPLDPRTPR